MIIELNKEKTELTIKLPYRVKGVVSKSSGKTLLHASEKNECILDGQQFTCQVNGYVDNPDYVAPPKVK